MEEIAQMTHKSESPLSRQASWVENEMIVTAEISKIKQWHLVPVNRSMDNNNESMQYITSAQPAEREGPCGYQAVDRDHYQSERSGQFQFQWKDHWRISSQRSLMKKKEESNRLGGGSWEDQEDEEEAGRSYSILLGHDVKMKVSRANADVNIKAYALGEDDVKIKICSPSHQALPSGMRLLCGENAKKNE